MNNKENLSATMLAVNDCLKAKHAVEKADKIEIGDEVMYRDLKAHYEDPLNTPAIGERGIVVKQTLMNNGVYGWAVRWSQGEIITCPTDSLTITEKGAAKAFKLGETVVFRKDLSFCPAGTFGKVADIKGQFYEVEFENGKNWVCSEHEIGKPTKSELNLHSTITWLKGVLDTCQN